MNNKQKINAIAVNVKNILETVGLDTTDPSIKDTPMRVAKMYVNEIFFALGGKPPKCTVFPNDGNNQMVLIRKIDFYSVCEHHLVPFVGKAYCAYLPDKKLLGLSKFNRVVNYFASKPQLQERLTTEIAEYLSERLGTDNVAVLVCAQHYCCRMRGIKDQSSDTVTSHLGGAFSEGNLRNEFLQLIGKI
jgi:GTP cyclohydrolase I